MFTNHGHFKTYKNPTHPLAAFGAAFFRNQHGKDWYDLQSELAKRNVKQAFAVDPASNRALRAVTDPSLLVPDDMIVITSSEAIVIDDSQNFGWDGTDIVRLVRDDELPAEAAQEAFDRVLDAYPPAPARAVAEVLAMDFDGIDVAPITRPSDGQVVGIHITRIYDDVADTGGERSLRALNAFDAATLSRGIPSIQILDPDPARLNKDRWAEHILARFQTFQAIYGRDRNYVYRPISIEQWASRQWGLIKEARERTPDVALKNTTFQADADSRINLNDTLTAVDGGWQLPAGFVWRDADNNNVPMTTAELRQLAALMATQREAAYRASWTAKAALDAIVAGDDLDDAKITAIRAVTLNDGTT